MIVKRTSLDGVEALPDHGDDWARGHVVDEAREELLGGQISVVLFEVFAGWGDEFHGLRRG